MASGGYNIPQHQKATSMVSTRFMDEMMLTKSPSPIIFDEMCQLVDESWVLAIDGQEYQWASGGTPVGTPSVC